jgi:hypothetical protein
MEDMMTTTATTTPAAKVAKTKAPAKTTTAKVAKVKTTTAKKELPKGTFTLAGLARELGVNPKVARAKARRHEKDLAAFRSGTDGWLFQDSHKADVSKVIKAS